MAKNPRAQDPNLLPEFDFAQSSQWLPGSAESLEVGTDFVYSKHPAIVTFTEIFSRARSRQLQEEGYSVHHKVGTDSAVAWDITRCHVLHAETVQVTDKTYWTKDGKPTKPQQVAFVVLEFFESGHRVLVEASHQPPRTEGTGGPGGIWRPEMVRRWTVTVDALAGIRRERKRLKKMFHYDAEIMTADWNLDIMRSAVRAWFKIQFPSMTPNFPVTYRGIGSLGRRVGGRMIDFSLLRNLAVTDGPEVFDIEGADHNSVLTGLKFVKPASNVVTEVPPVVTPPVSVDHPCPACGNRHTGVISAPSR